MGQLFPVVVTIPDAERISICMYKGGYRFIQEVMQDNNFSDKLAKQEMEAYRAAVLLKGMLIIIARDARWHIDKESGPENINFDKHDHVIVRHILDTASREQTFDFILACLVQDSPQALAELKKENIISCDYTVCF
jgi:hypothetical protein